MEFGVIVLAAASLLATPAPRDPQAVATEIDRLIEARLVQANVPLSPDADDAEFLRRVSLDLSGSIPSCERAVAFLDDPSPDKRRRLVDDLLSGRAFAEHLGRRWRHLVHPRDTSSTKQGPDRLTPWFASQFQANRPWDEVVTDLLTSGGSLTRDPDAAFYLANSAEFSPRPELLTASAGRLFLGVQIACAECHNHPFSSWSQEDFWGLAAFFGRLKKKSKGDFTLIEASPESGGVASIVIPDGSGKGAGTTVAARFLDGRPAEPTADGALRPQLAAWIASRDNPWFAQAMVNRLWAQMFARGLVEPVDDLRPENPPTHPELLRLLAAEFADSGFDIQHLLRCVCLSRAYQRTSRPVSGNANDATLLSHMPVKVLTPDVLYDALGEALNADPLFRPMRGVKKGGRRNRIDLGSRDDWARAFGRSADAERGDRFAYGVPEMLRLMNAAEFNTAAPLIGELVARGDSTDQVIETLYLAALSRRPSAAESARMQRLVAQTQSPEQGLEDVLWVLLHSSEFITNR